MHIIWDQNPLWSEIHLDQRDLQLFRVKCELHWFEQRYYSLRYYINKSMEAAQKYAIIPEDGWDFNCDLYTDQLARGIHCGDCTCMPATCFKCVAEDILEVRTIEGLGTHQAHKIDLAFTKTKDIAEAIAYLKAWDPQPNQAWIGKEASFNMHVPRWKAEALQAAVWLSDYRDKHFPHKR